jgi:hypothetical protein
MRSYVIAMICLLSILVWSGCGSSEQGVNNNSGQEGGSLDSLGWLKLGDTFDPSKGQLVAEEPVFDEKDYMVTDTPSKYGEIKSAIIKLKKDIIVNIYAILEAKGGSQAVLDSIKKEYGHLKNRMFNEDNTVAMNIYSDNVVVTVIINKIHNNIDNNEYVSISITSKEYLDESKNRVD